MMPLLVLRARLRSIYQKYELYIEPIIKFAAAVIVFLMINNYIGYDERLKKLPIVLALSLLSAFTPSAILVLLAALVSVAHVYFKLQILSILIVLIMLILYCLFLRFTPRLGYVMVAIPILYLFHLPYLVPILLGLFATPVSIVPTGCGVLVYYLFKIIKETQISYEGVSIDDTLQLYTDVINKLISNKQMFLTIAMFSLIILVTYFIRRKKFDYAREIAIAAGALTCILGFLMCDLQLDISEEIVTMIVGTLVSAIIAVVVQFFHLSLDYTGVELVQFEDDDYYYYVKAVPKINVTTPQINVKRINAQTLDTGTGKIGGEAEAEEDEEYEEYQRYYKDSKDDV